MQLSGDSGRDRAYQHLRAVVLSDPAVSGTFINEQAVATEVGISRTPVREALLMLAAEDLVQLVPHRGAFVAPVPGREIAEMMQARGVIECWAATTALTAGNTPVAAMSAVLDQQREIVGDGDAKRFIELDSQFHALLVAAAGNSVLGRLYDNLRAKHVVLGLVALQRSTTRREEVVAEHQAIVDGLAAGTPDAAEKAILSHLDSTGALLMHG
ncbi:DNA-binding GntR family transcriptional regulator [Kribbella aluminosa]|uniref:DNA-binding GntR family transcriptional regulator n=1 Tax=Kribbella aluminosa TaxID=416017 RepID=A0ABS4UYW9_9ACTN|nr:GntR family transcriptional regulator [Kribbella aluminosa]MBP2356848.1 DNA-binding GntR family transcriptional regulator [Kribbella aluminosa]